MADLIRTNKELEDVRQKQATKITELLKVTNQQAAELNDQQKQSADFVQRLTDDVQSARRTIEQLRRSEKEVTVENKKPSPILAYSQIMFALFFSVDVSSTQTYLMI